MSDRLRVAVRSGAGQTEVIGLAGPTTQPVRRLGQFSLASATFSTVAVGSFAAGSATTEASTQPTSRLMRSRWAPVQAPRTHDPVTLSQAHRPFSPLARGLPSLDDTRCATYRIIPQGVGKVGPGGWLGDELDGAFWFS